jgi:hypothetical protein
MKHNLLLGIGILLIIIAGVLLYFVVTGGDAFIKVPDSSIEIKKLQSERDSIQSLFNQSVDREQKYILQAEADSITAVELEYKIAARESMIKTYKQRVDEISKIKIARPDSFLIKRYPDQ